MSLEVQEIGITQVQAGVHNETFYEYAWFRESTGLGQVAGVGDNDENFQGTRSPKTRCGGRICSTAIERNPSPWHRYVAMPSKSKSQQRLFGWVHACQKGTASNCPPNISKVAGSIKPSDAEDFARTKHKGLPERKKKKKKHKLKTFREWEKEMISFQQYRQKLSESITAAEKIIIGNLHITAEDRQRLKPDAGLVQKLSAKMQQIVAKEGLQEDDAAKKLFLALEQAIVGKRTTNQSQVAHMMGQKQPQPQTQAATGGAPPGTNTGAPPNSAHPAAVPQF